MKDSKPSIRIRKAFPDDLPFLRSLALEAFSTYGDYETILTGFFLSQGVYTYVAEELCEDVATPVGILMMVIGNTKRRGPYFVEIVAIAVDQDHRKQGIGSQMIDFAKQWPVALSEEISIAEIQLSVAEPNLRGRSFFERLGFVFLRKEPWTYPAGQKALRMQYILKDGD
ncbi:MAG: GNAT family N-acetyltransferase [Proteobacteria bacterium]|nr:GNAT family N-acetyltransferase [Pseudomonadota bacterium]NIS67777.1 GNAT family N-acetyltransferase [Pseudomonadota bacterium]